MPPDWDCNRTADFLTELEDLCKRYGLDKEDISKALQEHIDGCQDCADKVEKFEEKFGGSVP